MAMSSGLRTALSEGATWLGAGIILVGGVVYSDEIRHYVAPMLGMQMVASARDADTGKRPSVSLSPAEIRARQAEQRAAEAEARAHQAETRAKQASYAARSETRGRQGYGGIVELKAQRNGHYFASAEFNGRSVDVMVDTGATAVALTYDDAQRAGISVSDSDFTGRTRTANGEGRYAPITIASVTIGSITVHNVPGVVMQRGKLDVTLLGMSFLSKLSRAEMSNGTLVLEN